MTTDEAIRILDGALAQITATRETHVALKRALDILANEATKKGETPASPLMETK